MPTPPFAQLTATRNGGAPLTGAVTCAAGDTIQPGAGSTTGITAYDFRFPAGSYPDGWSTPAGWTLAAGAGSDIFWQGATPTPPSFTLPATSVPDVWLPVLTVNGYPSAGAQQLTDATMILALAGPSGLVSIGYKEFQQRNATKAWVDAEQANWTLVDAAIGSSQGAGGVLSIPAKAVVVGAGTNVQNTAGLSDLTITSAAFSTAAVVVMAADTTVDLRITATARNTGATGGTKNKSYRLVRTALWNKDGGSAPASAGDSGVISNYGDAGENTMSAQYVASGSTQVLMQVAGVAGHTLAMSTENCSQLRG